MNQACDSVIPMMQLTEQLLAFIASAAGLVIVIAVSLIVYAYAGSKIWARVNSTQTMVRSNVVSL